MYEVPPPVPVDPAVPVPAAPVVPAAPLVPAPPLVPAVPPPPLLPQPVATVAIAKRVTAPMLTARTIESLQSCSGQSKIKVRART
jgi:A-kinase anchor protein 14